MEENYSTFWKRLFYTKDERFVVQLLKHKTLQKQLFFYMLCNIASNGQVIRKANKKAWAVEWTQSISDEVFSNHWSETKILFKRRINWMLRIGLAQKIWNEI